MTPDFAARLRGLRLVTFDIDGVMTDGRVHVDDDGRETKSFYAPDGLGIGMLQRAGLTVALISGSPAPAIRHRAKRMSVEHVLLGTDDKMPGWRALLATLGIEPSACAHMGDDLPDLPLMRASGAAFTVAHAPAIVRAAADHVARAAPGGGAVREVCELILEARGALAGALAQYDRAS